MTDHQHRTEGKLLIQVRKMVVAIEHAGVNEYIRHRATEAELTNRMKEMRTALFAYEKMMRDRDDDE